MEVFDLYKMKEKKAFYKADEFKARHIILEEGDEILPCDMEAHVIFNVLVGEVEVKVDDERVVLTEGKCLVTDPATISMKANKRTKILGIQVKVNG
ncbi:MAG: hypothetical protein ACOCT7_02145 [Candidatus Saliniplasma sp.]